MKRFDARSLWGLLLIVVGALVLLQNFGLLVSGVAIIWAIIFAAAGGVFVYVFATDMQARWWAIIPGMSLLGIGGVIALDSLLPGGSDPWGGVLVLGSIGLSFLIIYFLKRDFWWAVIPGGVMATLALVAGLSDVVGDPAIGGVFFLGLAATFALVALLPNREKKMSWAWIPSGIMLVFGVILTATSDTFLKYLLPVLLILVGAYFIFKAFLTKDNRSF